MAKKDNMPGPDERDDLVPSNRPGDFGQSGTVGSEGGGTGTNRGMGRPEDLDRGRGSIERDDDDDTRSKEQGRHKPGSGNPGGSNR